MSKVIKRLVKWLLNSPQPKPNTTENSIHAAINIDIKKSSIPADESDISFGAMRQTAQSELSTMSLERLALLPSYLVPNARKQELRRFIVLREIKNRTEIESLTQQRGLIGASQQLRASQTFQSDRAGSVYVIQDLSSGLYKIGRTTNMKRRMRQLGVGKTARLVQERSVDDAVKVEKAAHQRHKASRLPQTEYFKLSVPPEI